MLLIALIWIKSWIGDIFLENYVLTPKVHLALLSASLFPIDWGNSSTQPSLVSLVNPNTKIVGTHQKPSCQVLPENKPPQSLPLSTLIPSSSLENDFFVNRLWRSLQTLFNLNYPVEKQSNKPPLPLVVVKENGQKYQVWVNNCIVATLLDEITANSLQQRLTQLVKLPNLDAHKLRPALIDGTPALMLGNHFLFSVDPEIARQTERSGDSIAIEWTNNLRTALNVPTLTLVQGQMQMYDVQRSSIKLNGIASWYGDYFHGRLTANGETYNQNEFTVAHRSLPFNTYLQVTNLQNGKSVIVRVNDRGPYIPPRTLDLSREAARSIDIENTGVIPYEAVILQPQASKITWKSSNLTSEKIPLKNVATVTDFD